jgi:hypothetical protein
VCLLAFTELLKTQAKTNDKKKLKSTNTHLIVPS